MYSLLTINKRRPVTLANTTKNSENYVRIISSAVFYQCDFQILTIKYIPM